MKRLINDSGIKRMFEFHLSTKVSFGCGSRRVLENVIAQLGWSNVGLVIDHNLAKLPMITELHASVERAVSRVVVGYCQISEPTYDALEEMRPLFLEQELDGIIGIGGGSALDMAKGMAVLTTNPEPAIYYRGFDRMTEPVLPIVAIPTTAGTGSEITPNASFIDTKEKRKMGINGDAVQPTYALLDPELTISCPEGPTVSAALDSIVHGVEAFVARKTNRMARMFAREGVQRVLMSLTRVVQQPDNARYREEVMYGAFLSAIALMHSGTGPAAAMSYPLGVLHGAPHGLGGAVFLPHVVEHNIEQGSNDYAEILDDLGDGDEPSSREKKAREFLEKMFDLWEELRVPGDLGRWGIGEGDLPKFISETTTLGAALEQNPVPFGEVEIKKILKKLGVG